MSKNNRFWMSKKVPSLYFHSARADMSLFRHIPSGRSAMSSMPSSLSERMVPSIQSVRVRIICAVGPTHLALMRCHFDCLQCLKCHLPPECRHHYLSRAGTQVSFASMDGLRNSSCFRHPLGMSPPPCCEVGPLLHWAACCKCHPHHLCPLPPWHTCLHIPAQLIQPSWDAVVRFFLLSTLSPHPSCIAGAAPLLLPPSPISGPCLAAS